MTLLALDKVTRRVGLFSLSIDALSIARGEALALTGPNGSGKTTLLRVLSLADSPDGGVVTLDGEAVPAGGAAPLRLRRRLAVLPQETVLFSMTVFENITRGLRFRDAPEEVVRKRVGAVMDRLGLNALARARPRELSGGEARRAAVARTLVIEADAYLLDEPTAGIDAGYTAVVEEMLKDLRERHGAAIVVTTHSRAQAARLAGRVVVLEEGRIVPGGGTACA